MEVKGFKAPRLVKIGHVLPSRAWLHDFGGSLERGLGDNDKIAGQTGLGSC